MKKERIVFITPTSSQPRHHKRITDFINSGFDVTVYSFRRGFYEKNTFPETAEIIYIGYIEKNCYIKRLFVYAIAILKIFFKELGKRRAYLFYSFGHDNVWIAWLVKPIKSLLVYEVGDIQYLNIKNGVVKKILFFLEKFILKRIYLFIVTSPAFLNEHYANICHQIIDRTLVVENKLSKNIFKHSIDRPAPRSPQSVIKIGFVGAFKYDDKFIALLEGVAKRQDRYQLHIFGDGPSRSTIEIFCKQYKNIYYHGPYKNPDDLNYIYSLIDISFCVYDNKDNNVKLAIPNKYYESIFFGVPLIVSSSTALATRINVINGGFIIDTDKQNYMEIFLDNLSAREVNDASINILKISTVDLIDNNKIIPTVYNCNILKQ